MPKLTPLAVQNADVLRALGAPLPFSGPAALAVYVERDKSNLTKTLKALREAGLVESDALRLAEAGQAMVDALDRAEMIAAWEGATLLPGGFAELLWIQVEPDPLNPRKHFDETAIDELADSIARDGLLENLVVRPGIVPDIAHVVRADGASLAIHRLVAGERRWRAIGRLIQRGEWPKDRPIMCKVVDLDDAGHRRVALIENLQRKDLRPIDEATALKELMAVTGLGTAELAKEIGFSQRFVQQRLQLLDLPETLQAQVNAGDLSIERARDTAGLLPKLPPIKQVELRDGKITLEAAKEWFAKQPKPLELRDDEWILALEIYDKVEALPLEPGACSTECHADARFDERVKALSAWPAYLLHEVAHVLDDGGETGRFKISTGYRAAEQLELKFGKEITTARGRLRALDALYANLGEAHTPPLYRTTWLNGPFEISEGLRQEIATARVQRAERQAAWQAERDAEDATRARTRQAHVERINAVRQEAMTIAASDPAERPSALRALAQLGGHRLPWSLNGDGSIVDADGGIMQRNAHWQLTPEQLASLQLIVAMANAGAGLTPPEPRGDDDEQLPREEFERLVGSFLCEDMDVDDAEAAQLARAGLDAFLRAADLTFGDPRQAWTYDAAMDLAEQIRVHGLGRQLDLEEAIAAADETVEAA